MMAFIRKVFSCKSGKLKGKDKTIAKTKQKNELIESYRNARIPKKIDSKTSLSKLMNYCETIDFTCEPDFRYIIPLAYINNLKSSKNLENTKSLDKYDIINESFLGTKKLPNNDFIITISPEVDVSNMCFIIKELMIRFSNIVYVDYIIKCPYNTSNNEINLQDIKLMTIAHLNEKINASTDEIEKFATGRNIISACMDVKNHKINIIKSNFNEKENNSIIHIKKEVSHLNLATNDNLAGNNKIDISKVGAKKPKKFKRLSFNNINDKNTIYLDNNKDGAKNKKYTYDEEEDNNSRENSHRMDNNYLNDSSALNVDSKYKDSKLNTIGKTSNDFNVNDINRMANINNLGSDMEILRSYKEKQISPSTAATEKSYYNGVSISKRNLNDSEIGRSLNNLKSYQCEPKGIYNPSVYCFMNTCIQCLLSIPELNSYFLTEKYKKDRVNKITQNASNALNEFISKYNKSSSNLRACESLFKICHSFLEPGQQHDCQEFLRRFLSKIQEELNYNKKYSFPDKANYQKVWEIYRENNPSFIDNIFCGLMRSSVICNKCKYKSDTYDPFLDLSVPIRRRQNETLENCLDTYFSEEFIDCDYKCSSCKKKTSITKKLEIVLAPPILTIHFKRFEELNHKINGAVRFDEKFDLLTYTSGEAHSNLVYELFAVAVHLGRSIFSGHYIAYGKRNGQWYNFNDSDVSLASPSDALSKDAYILFYRRI